MSWYGTHARRTKADVKRLLPPGSCKHGIYWFRVAIGSFSSCWYHKYHVCPRCGIPQWEILDKITALERDEKNTNEPCAGQVSFIVRPHRGSHDP